MSNLLKTVFPDLFNEDFERPVVCHGDPKRFVFEMPATLTSSDVEKLIENLVAPYDRPIVYTPNRSERCIARASAVEASSLFGSGSTVEVGLPEIGG
jgi:hypothetical protein|tara:strand:- start:31 stop:321 length:291 start_codon:yes stop_codon:yes gene_type:complete